MPESSPILAPVSIGELIDKITILRIKCDRFDDGEKKRNVQHELRLLQQTLAAEVGTSDSLDRLTTELQEVNTLLWDVEDNIRLCERAGEFGARFVELARSVYRYNDRRCAIKRQINQLLGSSLIEEKGYQVDQSAHA